MQAGSDQLHAVHLGAANLHGTEGQYGQILAIYIRSAPQRGSFHSSLPFCDVKIIFIPPANLANTRIHICGFFGPWLAVETSAHICSGMILILRF